MAATGSCGCNNDDEMSIDLEPAQVNSSLVGGRLYENQTRTEGISLFENAFDFAWVG